jgi:autoinducer 2 (AI-2) kinase
VTGRFVLGLDFGGGGVRCLGLDLDSGRWHCEHRAVRPIAAPGLGGLGQDLDVPALDTALADAVRSTLARLEASAADVGAVACTSQRHSTVVLDAEGGLLLATPNRDARAAGEGLRLAAEHGAGLHAMSGHWPLPIFTAARLQWLRDQRPELFERADRVLAASEWLAWRLCGVAAADPTHAGESLLFELEGRCWSKEWIERLGLPAALLPEPVEAGTPLGTLSDDAAAWLGLAAGATVAAGVADTQSGLVGCAVRRSRSPRLDRTARSPSHARAREQRGRDGRRPHGLRLAAAPRAHEPDRSTDGRRRRRPRGRGGCRLDRGRRRDARAPPGAALCLARLLADGAAAGR